jgi:hypothetical protein
MDLTPEICQPRHCANCGIDPVTGAYDMETLKEFVTEFAEGIDGLYSDIKAALSSVQNM